MKEKDKLTRIEEKVDRILTLLGEKPSTKYKEVRAKSFLK